MTFIEREQAEQRRRIAHRVRHLREQAGMNQACLAEKSGLRTAQIVSAIENGERDVTADELVALAECFNTDVEFFVDPTVLVGEGKFSWRTTATPQTLEGFEAQAGKWIAAWREASRVQSKRCVPFVKSIPLDDRSIFEEAWGAAEEIVDAWDLGPYPAEKLAAEVEEKLDILVLYVDAPKGISGAACWVKEFGTILINRAEHQGRRNFDLAHELFHLLTWQAMPPKHIEPSDAAGKRPRVELLADNFAGALLMPRSSVYNAYKHRGGRPLEEWLVDTAPLFKVSAAALYWRLVALRIVNNDSGQGVEGLRWQVDGGKPPRLFSKKFLERIHNAMENGYFSSSYVATLLGTDRKGLDELFGSYRLTMEGSSAESPE